MPSYVTPKKNTAFVFYVSLEDQAHAGLFKSSPTLAAGDVLVSTDDGAPGNIATLPTVDADFTKRLKVSLSSGEMNGDNVTVIFSDAAGAEWFDLEVNIQTSARQIDDLSTLGGTAQTGDAYAVVSHIDYGNAKLVRATTPANTLDVAATGEASANVTLWKDATAPAMTGDAFARLGSPAGASIAADIAAIVGGATADDVWDEVVDGTYTARQLVRLLASALAGKSTGGGTTGVAFRDLADTKDRITATVDADGNRTAVTLIAT